MNLKKESSDYVALLTIISVAIACGAPLTRRATLSCSPDPQLAIANRGQ
jgi:hypothetical protein